MDLQAALGLKPCELVALVGAGGKTTAAWRLLHLLIASGERTVFATTTHIFQPKNVPLILTPNPDPTEIVRGLAESPALVLAAARGERGDPGRAARSPYSAYPVKLVGLEPGMLSDLVRRLPGVTWLVEADGAKGRLLKAPAEHEPAIPAGADRVVIVAGLEAIDKPLDECTVHRPEIAVRLLHVPLGTVLTPNLFVNLIAHTSGGLKGIPSHAEAVALLTQRDGRPHTCADTVARQLLSHRRISRVVLVNLRAPDPVLEVWE
ncbi:MAG: selenium cofactor biosynthesis protein YqeC [Anaerolineae bacterium]